MTRAPSDAGWATGELHTRYYLDLVRLAVQLVDDLASAEDVVQDVFAALQGRPVPDDPLRYLRVAVVNRARSALRRRRSVRGYLERVQGAELGEPADTDLLADERARALLAVIDGLPRRQREVVVLRYYEDLPIGEIANTLGTSSSAVTTALSRALSTLGNRLGDRHEQ